MTSHETAIRALKGTFPAVDGWRTMDYEEMATRLFLSMITPFGHNAQMRERDIKLIAEALKEAGGANGK